MGSARSKPARDTRSAEQDRERCEAVGTRLQAVRHQRGGADAATHPDPVSGHPLVPDETEHPRDSDRTEVVEGLRVHEPA